MFVCQPKTRALGFPKIGNKAKQWILILGAALLSIGPNVVNAEFTIVSEEALVNLETGISTFTLQFSETPDFFTVDQFSRQANSFQYYIYGDRSLSYPYMISSLVRGSEIHDTGNSLTIRQARPSSSDPGSGGWGTIITQVPWFLDGSTISFDIQTSLLTSYFSGDGAFWYTVEVYEYGATSDTRGLIGDPSTHLLSNIATQSTRIDIKPGDKKNEISPRSRGRIWVAVLSNTETLFDPLQIKMPSVRFGPDGAKPNRHRVKDINKDGIADLLLRFEVRRTGIQCGSTEATLAGKTYDGQAFSGTDSIKTVGCH